MVQTRRMKANALSLNQAIREEQDAAFQETLRQDREKARLKREAEEAKAKAEAEEEAALRSAQDRKDKIRRAKIDLASKVPPEEADKSSDDVARWVTFPLAPFFPFLKKICLVQPIWQTSHWSFSK